MSVQNESGLSGYDNGRHSVTKLVVHLVFTTKYRRKLLTGDMIDALRASIVSACQKLECDLIEFSGESEHVHLLVQFPPKLSVSVLVNNLKSISSRQVRLQFPELKRQSKGSALWSRSYFACSAGGATLDVLKEYIENQDKPK